MKFLNLNELEYTDELSDHNYVCREHDSYAIAGSEELAMELLDYCTNKELNVHYCTVKLKDWVQLKNRLINRANNIKKWYDKVTDDGMLLRGAVYLDTTGELKDLNKLKEVMKKYKNFELDENKYRLLTSVKSIEKLKNRLKREGLFPARVEEYPTFDLLEKNGMEFSGCYVRGDKTRLMEYIELPKHPFFVGTQSHPEFKSRLGNPSPLFYGFVENCINNNK